MDYSERVIERAKRNGGYFRTADCASINVPRSNLARMVEKGELNKIYQGIFCLDDVIEDDLYLLHLRYPALVFSHETALFYLGYSDLVPINYTVSVAKGFNSSGLREKCKVVQCKKENLEKGVIMINTELGNPIPVYCIERTLCDLLHRPAELNKERFIPAIKKYLSSKERDNIKLLKYAELLGVESQIRTYMELLI